MQDGGKYEKNSKDLFSIVTILQLSALELC